MIPPLADALAWLREQQPAMEQTLADWVTVNSFTDHREGCLAMADHLASAFALPGLEVERVPSPSRGDHVVMRTQAPGAPIALVGHLDTVFPPGSFEGYRRDGELRRGPGVLDMKGGLVVVAFALRALAERGWLERVPLRVVVVADEEIGSPDGRRVIEQQVPREAQAALVFEAGRAADAIITRRKGTGTVRAVATGKAAHAGNLHHEGVNAIWALGCFVDLAQRLTDYDAGATVNVGRFRGGQVANTVPDEAEALVDIRFTSIAQGEQLVAALHEAARQAEARVPGARLTLSGGASRQPLERTPRSSAVRDRYAAAARAEGLGDGEAPLLGGGSDACTTSALGVASIDGLGPRGKGFHTPDEQIEAATLVPKTAALVRFLLADALDRAPGGG